MVRLLHIQDTSRAHAIIAVETVEKMVDALNKEDEKSEGELVNQVEQEVVSFQTRLQRVEGGQHRAVADARVAKKKTVNPCKTCSCVLYCQVTEHGPKAIPVVVNHYSYEMVELFDNMLDRSRLELNEYEEEKYSLANKDNTLMSLTCSVNLDLADAVKDL